MTSERHIREGALSAKQDPAPTPPGPPGKAAINPLTGRLYITNLRRQKRS